VKNVSRSLSGICWKRSGSVFSQCRIAMRPYLFIALGFGLSPEGFEGKLLVVVIARAAASRHPRTLPGRP
jgi:hypothetical protein